MARIAVLNLQSGIGMTRGYHQYVTGAWRYAMPHQEPGLAGAARFLKEAGVDLALCAEVAAARAPGGSSQVDRLALMAGMTHTAFFPVSRGRASKGEGSALVARMPLVDARQHPLLGGILPRSIGESKVLIDGMPVTVFVAHLALGRSRRQAQLTQLAALLSRTEGPVLLGGDFNERDPEAFALLTQAGLTLASSVPSYPSWNPQHALLALFASPHFSLERTEAHLGPAFSDHRPLVADIRLERSLVPA